MFAGDQFFAAILFTVQYWALLVKSLILTDLFLDKITPPPTTRHGYGNGQSTFERGRYGAKGSTFNHLGVGVVRIKKNKFSERLLINGLIRGFPKENC